MIQELENKAKEQQTLRDSLYTDHTTIRHRHQKVSRTEPGCVSPNTYRQQTSNARQAERRFHSLGQQSEIGTRLRRDSIKSSSDFRFPGELPEDSVEMLSRAPVLWRPSVE